MNSGAKNVVTTKEASSLNSLSQRCSLLFRLTAAAGAEEDGRQGPAGGGPAAGEQDLPRAQQPAKGTRRPHVGQDDGQRHLLPPEAASGSGHAVG